MGSGSPAPLKNVAEPHWLTKAAEAAMAAGQPNVAIAYLNMYFAMTMAELLYEARQEQITDLMNRIVDGQSRIKIDPSASEDFQAQQAEYLRELLATEAGFKLLSELDASSFEVTIGEGNGSSNVTRFSDPAAAYTKADGTPGAGSDITIAMNPALTTFAHSEATPPDWATERAKYGLYHELVHAWHATRGNIPNGVDPNNGVDNAEWQAVGEGPYADPSVSDNIIRAQMGKGQRPGYGGVTYAGSPY